MNGRSTSKGGTKIQQNLVIQVLRLLDHNADVGLTANDHQVPLNTDVKNKDTEVVQVLSERTRDVKVEDNDGRTPLHYAVICGLSEVINILLHKGGDLSIKDYFGNTPLHYAFYNCINVAETLLDNGAKVELKNYSGKTPLHIAVDGQHVPAERQKYAVSILLNRGANVNVRDHLGQTPLQIMLQCYRNYPIKDEVCAMLVKKGANVRVLDGYGRTALHVAILECSHCVPVMIDSRSGKRSVNIPDIFGIYPIHSAVQREQGKLVKLLLDNGARTNVKNPSGRTPLHIASTYSHYQETVFQLLLERGSNVNAKDNNKMTPLHVAADQYNRVDWHTPLCKALFDRGASPNDQDKDGMTPLHYAVGRNWRDAVELFLNAGADINSRNNNDVTPLRYEISSYTTKFLLRMGAEVNVQDYDGRTPMHYIAGINRRLPDEIVSELLDWGASLTIKDNSGKTPLYDGAFTSAYVKHAIKRKCVNLNSEFECHPLYLYEYERFRDSCREEVKRMKHEQFGKYSLYDIFSQYNDPRYLKNKELERFVKFYRLNEQFPIYDSLVKSSYNRAKERRDMYEDIVTNLETPFPREVTMHILTFVDDDTLRNVTKASKASAYQ